MPLAEAPVSVGVALGTTSRLLLLRRLDLFVETRVLGSVKLSRILALFLVCLLHLFVETRVLGSVKLSRVLAFYGAIEVSV